MRRGQLTGEMTYPKLRVTELKSLFLKAKEKILAPVTYANYKKYLDDFSDEFGACIVENLTKFVLQNYMDRFLRTPSKGQYIYRTLSSMFNWAFDRELVSRNPLLKIKCPVVPKPHIKCYNKDKYINLLNIIKENYLKYYPVIILLGKFGLRPGEATALLETDIKNNKLYIDKAHTVKEKKLS
jgi:hypothetical protein